MEKAAILKLLESTKEEMAEQIRIKELQKWRRKGNQILEYEIDKQSDCGNCRNIALLDALYKILAIVIRNKGNKFQNLIGEYQEGYRDRRCTVDQIFTIEMIISKTYEHNLVLNILFIDLLTNVYIKT